MLAIARGLLSNPKIIMFDEPSLGLAPVIVEEMFDAIVKINQTRKIPIVLVEQNAYMAMEISHRTYVLDVGHMKVDGIIRPVRSGTIARRIMPSITTGQNKAAIIIT